MKKQSFHNSRAQSGFSLVEVLVAITLLLIALVGPMTFFARSSQSAEVANDRVIATFLAQEGAELLQRVRDDYVLAGFGGDISDSDPWDEFLAALADAGCDQPSGCAVYLASTPGNHTQVIREPCPGSGPCRLYYSPATSAYGPYSHNDVDSEETVFSRRVYTALSPDAAERGREVEVVSTVEWRSTALQQTQRVEVRTTLFNVYADLWD